MDRIDTHNAYVRLGNEIARLTEEAGRLELAMSQLDGPMTLGVYNGLAEAHRSVIVALGMLAVCRVEVVK